ncbi:DUF1761 domain-containing protein [Novosphingobium sp.]|uniref:DUF1761 domain-containing protein n=1 Tax=Novosphingobium sp. TaxID=1874826 RepID=UPI00286B5B54|nr:DUF1761 domain-containing protein [Novosphingobium sp.]
MGITDWLGIAVAAAAGEVVLATMRVSGWRNPVLPIAMLVSAAMLGHAFQRIGEATLAAKPHLYAMQSGGLALAFVIPALWIVGSRQGISVREIWRDCAGFLIAYLAMGGVFWLLT